MASYAAGEGTSSFAYHPDLNQTTVVDSLGATWTHSYNADGITTSVTGIDLSSITLDADNNIATYTAPGGSVWSFTHDASGRLLTVTFQTHATPSVLIAQAPILFATNTQINALVPSAASGEM